MNNVSRFFSRQSKFLSHTGIQNKGHKASRCTVILVLAILLFSAPANAGIFESFETFPFGYSNTCSTGSLVTHFPQNISEGTVIWTGRNMTLNGLGIYDYGYGDVQCDAQAYATNLNKSYCFDVKVHQITDARKTYNSNFSVTYEISNIQTYNLSLRPMGYGQFYLQGPCVSQLGAYSCRQGYFTYPDPHSRFYSGYQWSVGVGRYNGFPQTFPPQANFTATPLSGPAPFTVNFTDTSTGDPTGWQWYFGDDSYSPEQNPVHTYMTPGSYTVSHAAMNEAGTSWENRTGAVNVTGLAPVLIVEVRDFNTLELIPNSTVSLYDYVHSSAYPSIQEWQNVTALNGTAVFTTSGSSHQYLLVNGTQYGVWASALAYSFERKDVTMIMNEQREEMKLKMINPTPTENTYSITFAELAGTDRNLTDYQLAFPMIKTRLTNTAGWQMNFYHDDTNISKADFGINGIGGIRESTLHIHVGHGYGNGGLELPSAQVIEPVELQKKWGGNNKWVVLHTCEALNSPDQWGNTLDTTHGIFGFKTEAKANPNLGPTFLDYSMNQRMPLLHAWQNATIDIFDVNTTAAVRFDTSNQLYYDHLSGYGIVEPDESPDDDYDYGLDWSC